MARYLGTRQIPIRTRLLAGQSTLLAGYRDPNISACAGPNKGALAPIQTFQIGSSLRRNGVDRELGAPVVKPSLQGHSVDSLLTKLMRRTGAGSFIVSSAIGHYHPVIWAIGGPFQDLIRQHPYATRYLGAVMIVAGSSSYVEDHRRVGAGHQFGQFIN